MSAVLVKLPRPARRIVRLLEPVETMSAVLVKLPRPARRIVRQRQHAAMVLYYQVLKRAMMETL
jgi:hypothetical protein